MDMEEDVVGAESVLSRRPFHSEQHGTVFVELSISFCL